MTRKDFELIAKTIADLGYISSFGCSRQTKRIIAEKLADALIDTNEHFDRARFIDACMDETEVIPVKVKK